MFRGPGRRDQSTVWCLRLALNRRSTEAELQWEVKVRVYLGRRSACGHPSIGDESEGIPQ